MTKECPFRQKEYMLIDSLVGEPTGKYLCMLSSVELDLNDRICTQKDFEYCRSDA